MAISILCSVQLIERIGRRQDLAIVGKTFTENIGIEKQSGVTPKGVSSVH